MKYEVGTLVTHMAGSRPLAVESHNDNDEVCVSWFNEHTACREVFPAGVLKPYEPRQTRRGARSWVPTPT